MFPILAHSSSACLSVPTTLPKLPTPPTSLPIHDLEMTRDCSILSHGGCEVDPMEKRGKLSPAAQRRAWSRLATRRTLTSAGAPFRDSSASCQNPSPSQRQSF